MPLDYYSQHGEDRWIVEHLELPEAGGVFVEVGAYDGRELSNTLHFEESRGWDGLCIEADPRQWHKLLVNRKCNKFFGAAGNPPRSVLFNCSDIPSHSGFGRQGPGVKVPVLPLWSILVAYGVQGPIDLLSLDTEGTELEVWETGCFRFDLPRIAIIEHDTAGLPSARNTIFDYFAALPYRLVHETVGNLIFERTFAAEGH